MTATPHPQPPSEKEREKRQRKLRKELLLLLKRLRKACARFEQVEQWLEYAQKALDIAERYTDVLSARDRQRIREAVELEDRSLAGVRAACQVLQLEIERILATLPAAVAGSAALGLAVKILIGLAVLAGATAAVLSLSRPASVRFSNVNCGPIPIAESLSPPIVGLAQGFGIRLPGHLKSGEVAEADIPALLPSITLDATHPPTLHLRTSFLDVPLEVSSTLADIVVNGKSVLGQRVSLRPKAGAEVFIEVICR